MSKLQTASNGQIQTRAQQPQIQKSNEDVLVGMLQRMGPEIARALPKHLTPDRMARICLTALRTTPKLAECTKASFAGSIMACAQLGLEPNTPLGLAYLIPYRDRRNNVTVCQIVLGYQGMIDLALRSGRVTSIKAMAVHEGDEFDFEHGLHERLVHRPIGDEDAPITHAYAIAQIKDGSPIFWVLSRPQIEKRRKRGASGKGVSTPWDTDYEAMAMKSSVRALWRWLPKSAEMATAQILEDSGDRGEAVYRALPDIGDAIRSSGIEEDAIDVTPDPEPAPEPGANDEP